MGISAGLHRAEYLISECSPPKLYPTYLRIPTPDIASGSEIARVTTEGEKKTGRWERALRGYMADGIGIIQPFTPAGGNTRRQQRQYPSISTQDVLRAGRVFGCDSYACIFHLGTGQLNHKEQGG